MGGNHSWLRCDGTYPEPDSERPHNDQVGNGDPIIAVIMFVCTLFGLLLLTALVHCGIVAWRGCRSHHRHRRHHRKQQLQRRNAIGDIVIEVGAAAATAPPHLVSVAVENGDAIGDDDGETSSVSSSSTTSSDTSLDSTTARIAAQVASRRRSRFIDLTGVRLGGGASPNTQSPMSSRRPSGVGGAVGFLRPPQASDAAAFDNPAYDARLDHY